MLAEPRAPATRARNYLQVKPHGSYTDDEVSEIVDLYYQVSRPVGLDPLLAIGQMCLETGHLSSFWSQPPRRNPAGIGVTGIAGQGMSFPSWPIAVRAHVGRLLAYVIPRNQESSSQLLLIQEALALRPLPAHLRGVAPALKKFGNGIWAAAGGYAEHIAKIANEIIATGGDAQPGAGLRFRVTGVAPGRLNFRDSPDGAIKGKLPEGTVVEKLSESGIWWQVRTPAGFVGWVAGRFLTAV